MGDSSLWHHPPEKKRFFSMISLWIIEMRGTDRCRLWLLLWHILQRMRWRRRWWRHWLYWFSGMCRFA